MWSLNIKKCKVSSYLWCAELNNASICSGDWDLTTLEEILLPRHHHMLLFSKRRWLQQPPAFFSVPNILVISACVYLSEYVHGRCSYIGLHQQNLPEKCTGNPQSLTAASATTRWNRDFILECEYFAVPWDHAASMLCLFESALNLAASRACRLSNHARWLPRLSSSNSVLLHLSRRSCFYYCFFFSLILHIHLQPYPALSCNPTLCSPISISIAHPPSQLA